jgi:hypothetical protein
VKEGCYLLPAATMATTMEVEVEELCRSTVASTPIITSATGLLRITLLRNTSPAVLPGGKDIRMSKGGGLGVGVG